MPKLSSSIRKAKLSSFASEIGGDAGISQSQNTFFLTLSFVNDPAILPEFLAELYVVVNTAAAELILAVGLAFTMAFQPLPHVLYSKGAQSNVLGIGRFEEDLVNVLFTLIWPLSVSSELVYAKMRTLEQDLIALAKEKGLYNEWIYLNYASQWQDPIKAYGTNEVAFLRSVSREYDPKGIFQKAVPGGFKLGI